MDAVELARRLQEEATCSICLDYFTDPVMTACGHNFCRECIQMSWEKGKGKKGKRKQKSSFPCPECREMSPQRNLRPNRLLTKVAEMARQHPGLQKRDLCQAHQEPLKLFCQDDKSPICVVCREAQEHRLHRVLPVDEAARDYKVKLEEDIRYFREEMVKTESLQAKEEQSLIEWQEKVKERRERILEEFQKVVLFLVEEERRLLLVLKKEEEDILGRLQDNKTSLDHQSCSLDRLLLQLEEQSQQGPLQMLQDMKDTLTRKESLGLQYPEVALPAAIRTVCRVPGQIEVLKSFQEDVVPDPSSAYPYLLLYESRQRRYLSPPPEGTAPYSKDRFVAYPCAVGQKSFSSGRHYWEVGMNLTGDALWALGVCRDNVSRKDRVLKSPENGFWVVQLSKGKRHLSLLPDSTQVTLTEPPTHMGIFLDFQAGEVSFYSVNDGSHLHSFSQAAFPGPLLPFFCLGAPKSGQMVISTVTMWVKG
ncbi:E3 ubiquitin-protein ligase TRIM17 [Onychomys torridus]|uniref:E3 ubiquitin-protein ligase TRIM17 n=1 Tax=Onychomys torridus TaxID=38674 RepID=UPI00167F32EC|nr:E3 ubiquitin-protein ligase TRIM17 [Onychomys torridus]XP_036051550.1 E3 ubiquitin-protein ligase TRIM17 [Onychomys torridus]